MRLRFTEAATAEQRAAVAAALERRGVQGSPTADGLDLDGPLTAEGAVEIAAFSGVAEILPAESGEHTVRDAFLDWVAGAIAILAVLILLASNFPAPLGAPADPLRTPGELKPTWPLLAWYSAVDVFPDWVPVPLLFLGASVVLLLWPRIGRRLAERRPFLHTLLGAAALLFAAALAFREFVR